MCCSKSAKKGTCTAPSFEFPPDIFATPVVIKQLGSVGSRYCGCLPPSAVLLRNATPSVFHQRHIGRVLRSSCNNTGRRFASSRGREPRQGRCPPPRSGD